MGTVATGSCHPGFPDPCVLLSGVTYITSGGHSPSELGMGTHQAGLAADRASHSSAPQTDTKHSTRCQNANSIYSGQKRYGGLWQGVRGAKHVEWEETRRMGWNGRKQGEDGSGCTSMQGFVCQESFQSHPESGLHLLNCMVEHIQLQHPKAPDEVLSPGPDGGPK